LLYAGGLLSNGVPFESAVVLDGTVVILNDVVGDKPDAFSEMDSTITDGDPLPVLIPVVEDDVNEFEVEVATAAFRTFVLVMTEMVFFT
jgi:hypothetical protein